MTETVAIHGWFLSAALHQLVPRMDLGPKITKCKYLTVNVLKFQKKYSDKMTYANSADPDQTAPEGAV